MPGGMAKLRRWQRPLPTQYQPVPATKPGLAVALADRLDSLAGLFAAGLAPTGTKDPFGLRRSAIGVVQPLIEHEIDFNLHAALRSAAGLEPVPVTEQVQAQVLDFITGRLRVVLMEMGFKHDVVDAVLSAQAENPAGAARAVRQLSAWVARPDWSTILPGYARCVRITRDQKKKFTVKPDSFVEAAEKKLFAALEKAEKKSRVPGSVDDFLEAFVPMIPAVTEFFDKVLVMAEDKVRAGKSTWVAAEDLIPGGWDCRFWQVGRILRRSARWNVIGPVCFCFFPFDPWRCDDPTSRHLITPN